MLFYIIGFTLLIFDLLFRPLNSVISILRSKTILNKVVLDSKSDEKHTVCIHHYVPLGLNYTKHIGGKDYVVGAQSILELSHLSSFDVFCVLLNPKGQNIDEYYQRYPAVKFIISQENRYDFDSYFKLTKLMANRPLRAISFFNDNVAVNSDVAAFVVKTNLIINLNRSIGMVGLGSNTVLTQSLFKKSFSPHVQTYGFTVQLELMIAFTSFWQPILKKAWIGKFFKIFVCRLLEQGLSKFILSSGHSLGFLRNGELKCYTRKYRCFDSEVDWPLGKGDYRITENSPFRFK